MTEAKRKYWTVGPPNGPKIICGSKVEARQMRRLFEDDADAGESEGYEIGETYMTVAQRVALPEFDGF